MATTVIVGGVAGGMSAATRLRRRDEDRVIIVFEAGEFVSFANCGLPYYVGGTIAERSSLLLQTPASLKARFNLGVRVGHRVTAIHPDAHEVVVRNESTGEEFVQNYDELILAPGAAPIIPPLPGVERALTLRSVEDVDAIVARLDELGVGEGSPDTQAEAGAQQPGTPRSAAIIGGGFIGIELAENFVQRGLSVTLVEAAPQILTPLDPEMAQLVARQMSAHGVEVRTSAAAAAIDEQGVTLADGSRIPADVVVMAVGVRPNSSLAREAGLAVGERGGIQVDEYLRTSHPDIFAVGDVIEKVDAVDGSSVLVPLAQTANRQGRLVADIITGRDDATMPVLGTAIVGAFGLAAGAVGWNEKRARAAGRDIRVLHIHPLNHAGYYPGASQLTFKLVVDAQTDAILGAQAVGREGVDKRIDVIATAMRAGLSASDLADLELAYAPQFGSAKDPINMAGFVNDNMINGERTLQWHELADAVDEPGVVLVDVRTPAEFGRGQIPGAINIPLDDLRSRLDEVAGRRVIVHCQVGLRGHLASCLLRGYGVDVRNLDGGYLTWTAGMEALAR